MTTPMWYQVQHDYVAFATPRDLQYHAILDPAHDPSYTLVQAGPMTNLVWAWLECFRTNPWPFDDKEADA